MYIMALNCGSSSLKYQIFDADTKKSIIGGTVEKIGADDSFITQKYPDGAKQRKDTPMKNHDEALNVVLFMLRDASIDLNEIAGVGHRVVMGGDKFSSSVEVTDDVISTINSLVPLAPLHNPAALLGINTAKQVLPNARHVVVFDSAFHQTMPEKSFRYAVPSAWYTELGVRRYGFHGTSHLYVSKRAAKLLGKPANQCNIITMHIGSGASAAAIRGGVSVDTSMGMTPTVGLPMGTRCGDLDVSVVTYVMERLGLSAQQILTHLNKKSGLLGITGKYDDRRDVLANCDTDEACRLGIDMEVQNVKKYIGSYMAELGHTDAIVFTAGVGENNPILREQFCAGLEELGIKLDKAKNDSAVAFKGAGEVEISAPDSKVKVFMIPTNEELVIVEDTIAILNGTYNPNHLDMPYSFA